LNGYTDDTIALRGAGVIRITQPAKGQRVTLDSILLADFCRIKPKDRVLEPGAGTGVITLLLAKKHPRAVFTAVEVQPQLADLCKQNIVDNSLEARTTVFTQDLRRLGRTLTRGSFSVIVANPPYIKEGTGRTSPHAARQIARHDHAASLESWLNLHSFLKNGGRYCLVFPAARLAELVVLMKRRKLEPKRLRLVHPFQDKPASIALIEAVKGGGTGIEVSPPLVIHNVGGGYTDELKQIYGLALNS
jgi:tRNA1Val (adenine37-N6)-methyltransferase